MVLPGMIFTHLTAPQMSGGDGCEEEQAAVLKHHEVPAPSLLGFMGAQVSCSVSAEAAIPSSGTYREYFFGRRFRVDWNPLDCAL